MKSPSKPSFRIAQSAGIVGPLIVAGFVIGTPLLTAHSQGPGASRPIQVGTAAYPSEVTIAVKDGYRFIPRTFHGVPDPIQKGSGGGRGGQGGGGFGGPGGGGGPGSFGGPPPPLTGIVPGSCLGQYLSLSTLQQEKLDRLVKTIDALSREKFVLPALAQLKLTDAQIRRIAAGGAVRDVLTADQKRVLDDNQRRPGPGGPGGPGGFGGPDGPPPLGDFGGLEGPGGTGGNGPPPRGESAGTKIPHGILRVPVVFSGGHETDPRDRGRPVVLIAAALGVPPDVFREAFSHVRPAPAGSEPEPGQVQANKAALMNALSKYGVTNERLDTVSNYYRYVQSRGEHWPSTPAVANALVKNGVIVGYEIVKGGSGYSSVPTVSVPNVRGTATTVGLSFGTSWESNGAVSTLTVPSRQTTAQRNER